MKKTIVAIAIAGLAASAGASAANLYNNNGTNVDLTGRVKATYTNGYDQDSNTNGSYSEFDGSGRLGFDLTQKLNDQWSALASAQWDVVGQRADNGNGFQSRNIYAGFDGQQYGKFTAGQNDGALYTGVLATTDIFNEWGDVGNAAGGRQQGIVTYDNSYMGLGIHLSAGAHASKAATTDSSIGYTSNADNFVNYATGNTTPGTTSLERQNVYAAALDYTIDMKDAGAVGLNGGYQVKNFDNTRDSQQKDWALGANYTWNGLYAAAIYNQTKIDNSAAGADNYKATGYELALTYTIQQWKLLTGYNKLRADSGDVGANAERDFVNEAYLGAQYNFTSNIFAYTEYKVAGKVTTTGANSIDPDNQMVVALQYNF
ncbi:porin [Dongshaea marina]|uniref:porin n=1 Tax=Dongshaea marina TaxID=2047966 RepID=UPI000D3EC8F0|nr:porin [Dongshaea marina]